jgi:DNA-binding CsgD family transcriptional regulator/PAS domain-containing protein
MRVDPDSLSRALNIGSEAGLNEAAWREFAEAAAEALGCQVAIIEFRSDGSPQASFLVAGGLNGYEQICKSALVRRDDDVFWQGMKGRPAGTVRLGSEMHPPEKIRSTRVWSAVATPWHLEHFLLGTIVNGDGLSAYLTLGRTAGEPAFVEGDKTYIGKLLVPSLARSIRLQWELEAMRGTRGLLSSALNQSPDGIVVFDGQGWPIFVNDEAAAVFATGDGLTLVDGALHAANPVTRSQLARALSSALHLGIADIGKPPGVVEVSREGTSGQYQVVFLPLDPRAGHANFSAADGVMAVIRGPNRVQPTNLSAMLTAAYKLSRAEIALCRSLLQGETLVEAAKNLEVSRNTAKTHLARIFDKTGVHSQAALLRLLTMRFGVNLPNLKGPSITASDGNR